MKKLLSLICLLLLAIPAFAQLNTISAGLVATSSACATADSCIALPVSTLDRAGSIQLGGTFVGTVTFEASANGGSSWAGIVGYPWGGGAAASTATATGGWTFDVAGKTNIRARMSAYTSGTANATLTSSQAGSIASNVNLSTSAPSFASLVVDPGSIVFEGATADAYETTLTVTDPAASDKTVTIPNSTFTVGQIEVTYTMLANGSLADQSFFVATRAYQVTAISEVHSVAGNNGSAVSLQVTHETTTGAPGAGIDLLTTGAGVGFDMKGTANTVQAGALSVTASDLQLIAGDRLSVDFAGTLTTLAGVTVTVSLMPN